MRSTLIVSFLVATLLAGCESAPVQPVVPQPVVERQAVADSFIAANYSAVNDLIKGFKKVSTPGSTVAQAPASAPFIVATVVNIDQLERSSTLGRLIAEQISSRLVQMGHGVVELKVRDGVYIKNNEGELMLTRELKHLTLTHKAQGIIVGTYAESASFMFVTLKLIDPVSGVILSASDYSLPKDRQIQSLLNKTAASAY